MCHSFSYFWDNCGHLTHAHVRCREYPNCRWLGHATKIHYTVCDICTDYPAYRNHLDPLHLWSRRVVAADQVLREPIRPIDDLVNIFWLGIERSNIPDEQPTPLQIRRLRELELEYTYQLELGLLGQQTFIHAERQSRVRELVNRNIELLHEIDVPRVRLNAADGHRIEDLMEMAIAFPDHNELDHALPIVEEPELDMDDFELDQLLRDLYQPVYPPRNSPGQQPQGDPGNHSEPQLQPQNVQVNQPPEGMPGIMVPLAIEFTTMDERQCSICMDDLGDPDTGANEHPVKLPCEHVFGHLCIERWLTSHGTCPICRRDYRPDV